MRPIAPPHSANDAETRARLGSDAYVRELAKTNKQIARALSEGYEINFARVVEEVTKDVVKALADEDVTVLERGTEAFNIATWQDRNDPREEAYAVLDRVREALASVRVPDGWSVTVGRIARFRADSTCTGVAKGFPFHEARRYGPCCRHRTVVIVHIDAPIPGLTDRFIVVNAEKSGT